MHLSLTPAGILRAKRLLSPSSLGCLCKARLRIGGADSKRRPRHAGMSSCSLRPLLPLRPSAPAPHPALPHSPPLPVRVHSRQSPGVPSGSVLALGLAFQVSSGCGPTAPLGTAELGGPESPARQMVQPGLGVEGGSCPGLTGTCTALGSGSLS